VDGFPPSMVSSPPYQWFPLGEYPALLMGGLYSRATSSEGNPSPDSGQKKEPREKKNVVAKNLNPNVNRKRKKKAATNV
jgi:hypothetical protein